MSTTVEYRIFGILIWSVTTRADITNEEAVYKRLSERFATEMADALNRAKRPQA